MERLRLRNILTFIGLESAVLYMLLNRGWNLASGAITLVFVARFLNVSEQGYYFTFASLLAMQVLFELGMSYVTMQFASHEMAHLEWTPSETIAGKPEAMSRLRSLLVFVAKWYGFVALSMVIIVLPAGIIFFSSASAGPEPPWRIAWTWLVTTTAVNIIAMPIMSMLEGCGKIVEVARIRMYQSMFGSATAWIMLACGGGLMALPAMNTCYLVVVAIWLLSTKAAFIRNLLKHAPRTTTLNWKSEMWPFQWKIAVSWLCSYFIFQIFVPILFYYRGSIEAGQMGMSMALSSALSSFATAWINAKAPSFGALVAQKNYAELDRTFSFALSRSLAAITVLGASLVAVNLVMHVLGLSFSQRLLDPSPFCAIIFSAACNYLGYALSTYLRAHKEEPFMILSVVVALSDCGLSFIVGPAYGASGVAYCVAAVSLVANLGGGTLIFAVKRKSWLRAASDNATAKLHS